MSLAGSVVRDEHGTVLEQLGNRFTARKHKRVLEKCLQILCGIQTSPAWTNERASHPLVGSYASARAAKRIAGLAVEGSIS